jgi:hypothetical protein
LPQRSQTIRILYSKLISGYTARLAAVSGLPAASYRRMGSVSPRSS